MGRNKILFATVIFCVLLSKVFVFASDLITVQPDSNNFFWHETQVPEGSRPLDLFFDLPSGMSLDKAGFINRRFCTGMLCMVPQTDKQEALAIDGLPYVRHHLVYRFETRSQIPLQPKHHYTLKMRLRYSFQRGFASVLLRTGDQNGGLTGYSSPEQYSGESDWREVSYDLHPGERTYGVIPWFHKDAGEDSDGYIELASLELFEGEQKIALQSNDFSKDTGGWGGSPREFLSHNAGSGTVLFRFNGAGSFGYTYQEPGVVPAGTRFRTAPAFSVQGLADGEYPIYLWEGGQRRKLQVTVKRLPPVRLKKMEAAFWLAESPYRSFSPGAKETFLKAARHSGFNAMYMEGPDPGSALSWDSDPDQLYLPVEEAKTLAGHGFRVFAYIGVGGKLGPLNNTFLQKYPEGASVTWQNLPNSRICGTYQMETNDAYLQVFERVFKRFLESSPVSGYFWDIESLFPVPSPQLVDHPGALDKGSACYCERCIKKFLADYGITDLQNRPLFPYQMPYNYDNIPEPARSILQKCPLEWTHFVLRETVWQAGRLQNAIKSVRKEAELRIYTGMHTRGYWRFPDGGLLRWSEYCGVDRLRMAQVSDGIMGCHDLGFNSEIEAITLKEASLQSSGVKKPVILDISTQGLYGEIFKNLYPRLMHIFALCEADGVAIWGMWELDSFDFNELRRGLADVARFEDFFVKGRRVDSFHQIDCKSPIKAATWILGGKRVVFVMNPEKRPVSLTLRNLGLQPAAPFRYRATLVNAPEHDIPNPAEIPLEIPAQDLRIIEIEDISTDFIK